MKILVLERAVFIGKNVIEAHSAGHEVVKAYRGATAEGEYDVDLLQPESIAGVLNEARPYIVVSCAGIVGNNEHTKQNVAFTGNLLQQVIDRSRLIGLMLLKLQLSQNLQLKKL